MRRFLVLLFAIISQISFSLGNNEKDNESGFFQVINEENIDILILDALDFNVEVRRNWDNRVELNFESSKPESYRIEKSRRGNQLIIRVQSNNVLSFFETRSSKVTIFVPDMTNVEISGISGDIYFEKVNVNSTLTLTSGDITLDSTDGYFSIDTTSSDINIGNFVGKLDIKGVSGDIRGNNITLTQDSMISVISGDIEIDLVGTEDRYNVTFNSVSGKMKLFDLEEGNSFSDSNNGVINLRIKTTSGSVLIY